MKRALRVGLILFGVLAAALAAFAAVNWVPERPVSVLAARWARPPSQFIDIGGMKVYLRDEGIASDPVPIVLLHGTSSSLYTWEGWVQSLKDTRRVITFDLPGYGLTGPFPHGNYKTEAYIAFMRSLFDALGIERCVLGGNSFGGDIAWQTALAMPGRVTKLILVDSGGYGVRGSLPVAFRVARTPVLNRLMERVLPRGFVEASLRNVYGDPAKVTPRTVDIYFDMATREGNRRALVERFRLFDFGAHAGRIPSVKTPTLILWGGRDRLVPPADAEHFHRDIAGSTLVIFPELGHVPQEEDPAATIGAVKAFLTAP
jgi:pimeloyl-ACP methyl ester carboxylesterase